MQQCYFYIPKDTYNHVPITVESNVFTMDAILLGGHYSSSFFFSSLYNDLIYTTYIMLYISIDTQYYSPSHSLLYSFFQRSSDYCIIFFCLILFWFWLVSLSRFDSLVSVARSVSFLCAVFYRFIYIYIYTFSYIYYLFNEYSIFMQNIYIFTWMMLYIWKKK